VPETAEDPAPENGESKGKEEEGVEFDEDYSPKRGLTFIFASAGVSLFLLAVLAGLRPYIIPKIAGAVYSQIVPYGYNPVFDLIYTLANTVFYGPFHFFDIIFAIAITCAAVLVAELLYFSWSGDKKPFPDSSLIGLSVSIISIFIQSDAFRILYTLDWVGILVLLALGVLFGYLGFKLSTRYTK